MLLYRRLRYGYAFRRIPLTQGEHAIVDPDDYERLSKYNWHVNKTGQTFYAKRSARARKTIAAIYMHRCIIKVPAGMVADHINHNGLDNRKANLRLATLAQNNRHRKKFNTKSRLKYKGTYYNRRRREWYARIICDGEPIHLGTFKDEIEAAKAYDQAAKKYHGEFAGLNFPQ